MTVLLAYIKNKNLLSAPEYQTLEKWITKYGFNSGNLNDTDKNKIRSPIMTAGEVGNNSRKMCIKGYCSNLSKNFLA